VGVIIEEGHTSICRRIDSVVALSWASATSCWPLVLMLRAMLLLATLLLYSPLCGDSCAPCLCCAPACPPRSQCCVPIPTCAPQAPSQALRLHSAPQHALRPRVLPLLDLNAGNFQGAWGAHAELSQVAGRYHQLGVKQLRTHDYSEALDIAHIYPDLSKDPATSMNFTLADEAFASIVSNGFTPFLRLGNSGGQQPGSQWEPDVWGGELGHLLPLLVTRDRTRMPRISLVALRR
jgi:hypothetical protein